VFCLIAVVLKNCQ